MQNEQFSSYTSAFLASKHFHYFIVFPHQG